METTTGGDSWLTREIIATAAAKAHPPAAAIPVLRLRTDATTKSFRLERHDRNRWLSLASFPVAAGSCKPDPPKPVVPAEEPPPKPAEAPPPKQ